MQLINFINYIKFRSNNLLKHLKINFRKFVAKKCKTFRDKNTKALKRKICVR